MVNLFTIFTTSTSDKKIGKFSRQIHYDVFSLLKI